MAAIRTRRIPVLSRGRFAWTSSVNCGLSAISFTQSRSLPRARWPFSLRPRTSRPYMHTFFDAGIVVVSSVVAMLLWDMGWRADDNLTRLHRRRDRHQRGVRAHPRASRAGSSRGMPSTPRDLPDCCGRSPGRRRRICCRSVCARHTRCASSPRSTAGAGDRAADPWRRSARDLRSHPSVHGADWFGITRPSLALVPLLSLLVRRLLLASARHRTPRVR